MEISDAEDAGIVIINNIPGFPTPDFYLDTTPAFFLMEDVPDTMITAFRYGLDGDITDASDVLFDADLRHADRQSEQQGDAASKLEYILPTVFGSIVAVFIFTQVIVHCRSYATKKHTWRIGSRNWWQARRRTRNGVGVGGGVGGGFRCASGAAESATVWAHHYEPYPMVPCRNALAYGAHGTPCARRAGAGSGSLLDDYSRSSGSDSATNETPSRLVDSTGSRCSQSCGSSSTLLLLSVDLERRANPYISRTDTIAQVHSENDDKPPLSSCRRSDVITSDVSSSSSLSVDAGVVCPRLPIYHALLATSIPCENPGYDTDADSNPKLPEPEITSSEKSTSDGSDVKRLKKTPSGSTSSGESWRRPKSARRPSTGLQSVRIRICEADKQSDESFTTVSSMSTPGSHYQSDKTLSGLSAASG